MVGVVVVAVVLLAAVGFGLWRRRNDGRLHRQEAPGVVAAGERLSADDLASPLGERATLVQFSTAFCAPCRTTRVLLADVAATIPGVAHVEIDAEAHLPLVRRLDVRRTPTVLVLDGQGVVRTRAAGAPRRADVIAALGRLL